MRMFEVGRTLDHEMTMPHQTVRCSTNSTLYVYNLLLSITVLIMKGLDVNSTESSVSDKHFINVCGGQHI